MPILGKQTPKMAWNFLYIHANHLKEHARTMDATDLKNWKKLPNLRGKGKDIPISYNEVCWLGLISDYSSRHFLNSDSIMLRVCFIIPNLQ